MRPRSMGPLLLALVGGGLLLGLVPALHRVLPSAANADAAEAAKPEAVIPDAIPSPRTYPRLSLDPAQLAEQLARVESALRDPATSPADLGALGHQEQVIIRLLARQAELAQQVRVNLPERWRPLLDRHLAARREFQAMQRGRPGSPLVPAWRIIPPEPPERLLGYYRKAQAATGIPWEVLAAINLVETGMGRIDGISVADARGPMQFLPTTWAERGIGAGDIRDPHDAIQAAARYLVRRGGPKDLPKAIWGYNNSDHYVRGVLGYAALLREDPAAFTGLYNWEIHFISSAGDLWLPVGYEQRQRIPVNAYLQRVPSSAPPRPSAAG